MLTRHTLSALALALAAAGCAPIGQEDLAIAQDEVPPGLDRQWAPMNAEWSVIDEDADGFITSDELQAYHEATFATIDAGLGDEIEPADAIPYEPLSGRTAPQFDALDADTDRQLTRQEFLRAGQSGYARARTQAGGEVTTEAYLDMTPWREGEVMIIDQDRDAAIAPDEAAADWERVFATLDQNADGVLTGAEWQAEVRPTTAQAASSVTPDAGPRPGREQYMAARAEEFAAADLDGDGRISVWEYRATRVY